MAEKTDIVTKPTYVEYKGKVTQRFLIMDAPTDANLPSYVEIMKKRRVKVVVRACQPTYSTKPLVAAGIPVKEMAFPDGDPPPEIVLQNWLDVVDEVFSNKKDEDVIAVHCVAGLGRAPVLVTAALLENGMEAYRAITFIRKHRRGAINTKQAKWLESYKRRRSAGCCTIQ